MLKKYGIYIFIFIIYIFLVIRIKLYETDLLLSVKIGAGLLIFYAFIFLMTKLSYLKKYGYINNKKIDKNNTPICRDIPFSNIFYANALISLNQDIIKYKPINVIGAVLLKWIKEEKIYYDAKESLIDLRKNPQFDNHLENGLFNRLYSASKDGILSSKEIKVWAIKNHDRCIDLIRYVNSTEIAKLQEEGHIYNRKTRKECKRPIVMDDKIYDDVKKLYGLKLFLENFSLMGTKEAFDVHLWEDYLMYAYLFGIADKVLKQFKKLYPDYLYDIDLS